MRNICLPVLTLLIALSPQSLTAGDEEIRVLFVGNSYSFQVPKVFAKLAESKGKKVVVEQVTKGGWTLKKHAAAAATRERISGSKWDFVVLQEQSQIPSFADAEKRMLPAAKALAELAGDTGGEVIFFETWGRRDGDVKNRPGDTFAAMQKRLTSGYAAVAEATGGEVAKVGTLWSKLVRDEFWGKDGSHPSKVGVYLAACVFYTRIYGESPEGAKFDGGVGAEVAAGLQRGAGQTLVKSGEEKKR